MNELATTAGTASIAVEHALIKGDLSKLTVEERLSYYNRVCASVGLNPLTQPFAYILLNGKLTLYAKKDATDQLRSIHQVSVTIVSREVVEGVYVVTANAAYPNGRKDESIGAVPIQNLKGDAMANAIMKAETKAKRRVTLSICGLGFLDETELETIPNKAMVPVTASVEELATGGYDKEPLTETESNAQRILEERRAEGRKQLDAMPAAAIPKISEGQRKMLYAKANQRGVSDAELHNFVMTTFKKASINDLTWMELNQTLKHLEIAR